MDFLKKLILLNKDDPLTRFNSICEMEVIDSCVHILLCLYVIDEVIKQKTGTLYNYYIQDDLSVQYLLNEIESTQISEKSFQKAITILDISKLIYRFTCAKKFNIKNDAIVQLRINSWGRTFLEENKILDHKKEVYSEIYRFFTRYFEAHENQYKELSALLINKLEQSTNYVQEINAELKIKLLS